MFEAHIYTEAGNPDAGLNHQSVKPNTSANCWHTRYQCNVRYWLAEGKRQTRATLFLYIEYYNRDNSHGYKLIEIPQSTLTVDQAQRIISQTQLSPQLDPIKTEQWCKTL
ncbi:hypothetical protein Q4488_00410 [Amphritea sp. 1_MG-2023]|uniref:hypothetical protein n=1 Tax=Amphritea sp. 1_MG-2023 TaxID=3062670 RepID=UPI0026E44E3B|nr:hypothetical protein [Amphritea sp. 1_MG-2023]MDO6561833.1 hypothetical protein [Amphritea sp. 1_MG-2023]